MSRRLIPTERYVIPPHSWQAYGHYPDGQLWASPCRASNEHMARDQILHGGHMLTDGAVITRIHRIAPMERSEKDRKRWRRNQRLMNT